MYVSETKTCVDYFILTHDQIFGPKMYTSTLFPRFIVFNKFLYFRYYCVTVDSLLMRNQNYHLLYVKRLVSCTYMFSIFSLFLHKRINKIGETVAFRVLS